MGYLRDTPFFSLRFLAASMMLYMADMLLSIWSLSIVGL